MAKNGIDNFWIPLCFATILLVIGTLVGYSIDTPNGAYVGIGIATIIDLVWILLPVYHRKV